jgi:hypothetical protein
MRSAYRAGWIMGMTGCTNSKNFSSLYRLAILERSWKKVAWTHRILIASGSSEASPISVSTAASLLDVLGVLTASRLFFECSKCSTRPRRSSSWRTRDDFELESDLALPAKMPGAYSQSNPNFWQDSHFGNWRLHFSFLLRQKVHAMRLELLVLD